MSASQHIWVTNWSFRAKSLGRSTSLCFQEEQKLWTCWLKDHQSKLVRLVWKAPLFLHPIILWLCQPAPVRRHCSGKERKKASKKEKRKKDSWAADTLAPGVSLNFECKGVDVLRGQKGRDSAVCVQRRRIMDVKAHQTRRLKMHECPPHHHSRHKKKKKSLSLYRIELSRVPVISQNPQVENGNDTT